MFRNTLCFHPWLFISCRRSHVLSTLYSHFNKTSKFIVKQPVHINNLWNTAASGSAGQTVIKVSVRRFDGSNWTFLQETGWKCPDWPVFQCRNCRTLRNISRVNFVLSLNLTKPAELTPGLVSHVVVWSWCNVWDQNFPVVTSSFSNRSRTPKVNTNVAWT